MPSCRSIITLTFFMQWPRKLHSKFISTSNSTPAEYKILWMKKSQNMLVWLSKLVLVQHFVAAKVQQSLTPVVDWLDGLVGPDGLLLLVCYLLQSPFQFCGGSTHGQDVNLQQYFSHRRLEQLHRCSVCDPAKIFLVSKMRLVIYFFLTPPIKLKLGLQTSGRLLIANNLEIKISSQSIACVRLDCAFCQPQHHVKKCRGQNHFAEPNQHILTLLLPIL